MEEIYNVIFNNMIFNNIIVNNFRGIKTAKIEDFRRINVFFGKNNCGKSTLLEALFLISGQSNPLLPFTVNTSRGFGRYLEEDLGWIFHDMDTSNPVHIATDGDTPRHMDISVFKKTSATVDLSNKEGAMRDTAPSFYGYAIDFDGGMHSELSVEAGNLQNSQVTPSANYSEPIGALYLTPRVPIIDAGWDALKLMITNKRTDFLVKVLQDIEPKVQSIMLVGEIVMVDIGGDKLLPLQMMGDGVLRILSLIVNIYKCTNGVLIVDELDNGFHYSVMNHLWSAIFAAAKECNVQLFISTHNIDSLRALSNLLPEQGQEYKEMLSAYKLVHTDADDIQGLRYDAATLSYMINQEIEIR